MASVTLGLPVNFYAVSTALQILGTKKAIDTVSASDSTANKATSPDFAWQVEMVVIGGICLWTFVAYMAGCIIPLVLSDPRGGQFLIVGKTCMVSSLLYYISPFSVLLEILRKRDGSGLHAPMILLNLLATTLWFLYGMFYMKDINVYVPNLIAMLLSVAQLSLKAYFPSVRARRPTLTHSGSRDRVNSLTGPKQEGGLSPMHLSTTSDSNASSSSSSTSVVSSLYLFAAGVGEEGEEGPAVVDLAGNLVFPFKQRPFIYDNSVHRVRTFVLFYSNLSIFF